MPLDDNDLWEADVLTYNYTRRLSKVTEPFMFLVQCLHGKGSILGASIQILGMTYCVNFMGVVPKCMFYVL